MIGVLDAAFVGLAVGAALLLSSSLYGVLVVVSSWFTRRRTSLGVPSEAAPRVAALVVAHDEERVIRDSVRSLGAQRYREGRLTVFVVADRCSDRTAELAATEGATVLRRDSGVPGKPQAIAFAVARIAEHGDFDAVAIFDADNHVEPDFVARVAERLASGERAVQGFVDAKNPGASWVAASSALGYWGIAGTVAGPKERLLLSTPPMGTGFCLRLEDARRLFARTESVTDDLELSALLALDGIRVAYEPRARLLDEKPRALGTALVQRHRWMRGRWDVASRYVGKLVFGALPPGAARGDRLRRIDVALALLSPSLSFAAVGLAGIAALELVLANVADGMGLPERPLPSPGVLLGAALIVYLVPLVGLVRFRPSAVVWLGALLQPLYLAFSAPLAVLGFFTRDDRAWNRTHKGSPPGSP
ncbi:MAG TPA: glycosyltransferase family 2 protein [Polyangiaceae bacterium]|nr:glycosyltransferase family 2 protein [Polyangiaceae bacterium]